MRVESGHVTLSTVVQVHNGRGRAYSALVRLVHPIIVRALLGRAARNLHRTEPGNLHPTDQGVPR